MSRKRLFVFDRYGLDEQERQLLLGTQVVPLPPKVFDLLAVLVQNAGRLLPKQDLLDRVWSGVAVEEGSLTRGISSLRQVLGSTTDGQDYIQTVSKRGYRFVSQVRETPDDELEGTRLAIPPPPSLLATASVDFVGRDAELVQIQDMWRRAKDGRHQLVLVAGEPGMSVQWNGTRPKRCSSPNGCSAPISQRTQSPGWRAAGRQMGILARPSTWTAEPCRGRLA
jgi:DNA-binding winged helix-turn-helix (wHTH) protein